MAANVDEPRPVTNADGGDDSTTPSVFRDDEVAVIVELEERKKSGHVRLHPVQPYLSQTAGDQTAEEILRNARQFILLQRERIASSIDLTQIPKDVKVCAVPAASSGKRSPDEMSVPRHDQLSSGGDSRSDNEVTQSVVLFLDESGIDLLTSSKDRAVRYCQRQLGRQIHVMDLELMDRSKRLGRLKFRCHDRTALLAGEVTIVTVRMKAGTQKKAKRTFLESETAHSLHLAKSDMCFLWERDGLTVHIILPNKAYHRLLELVFCSPALLAEHGIAHVLPLLQPFSMEVSDQMSPFRSQELRPAVAKACKLLQPPPKHIPPEVMETQGLEELGVNAQLLTSLPPELARLVHLKVFSLDGHDRSRHKPLANLDVIWKLRSLTTLSVIHCHIGCLPPDFFELQQLNILLLEGVGLEVLPPEIGQLSQLKWLNLRCNRIKSLPDELGILTNLAFLCLRENNLNTLADSIGNLSCLEHIDLFRNKLTCLPPAIGKLSKLQFLYLGRNKLKSLPQELGQCTALEELGISHNCLCELPKSFSNLKGLRSLHAFNNRGITEFPPVLLQLEKVQLLSLNACSIASIPKEVRQMSSLRTLHIEANPILRPPMEVCRRGIVFVNAYHSAVEILPVIHKRRLKVVILGDSMAGKTSLAMSLKHGKAWMTLEHQRTVGWDQLRWDVGNNKDEPFSLLLVDFGGQEAYDILHKLFLSPPVLVLMVVDLVSYRREAFEQKIGRFLLSASASLTSCVYVVVGTHVDQLDVQAARQKCAMIQGQITQAQEENSRRLSNVHRNLESGPCSTEHSDDDLSRVRDDIQRRIHPPSLVDKVFAVSCKNNKGLPDLQAEIVKMISTQQELMDGIEVPKAWLDMEELLVNVTSEQPHRLAMHMSELESRVEQQQIDMTKPSILTGLAFMHGLGVALHFTNLRTPTMWHGPQHWESGLEDWVFFNMSRLARIVRAIFRHDHTTYLCYENFAHLREAQELTEPRFRMMVFYFLESAVLGRPLLKCMLALEGVDCKEDTGPLLMLLERLGLSYDIPLVGVNCEDSQAVQSQFIPYFCRSALTERDQQKLWPSSPHDGINTVTVHFSVSGTKLPAGLWEQVAVSCHRFLPTCFHWRRGVIGLADKATVMAEVHAPPASASAVSTTLRFSCRAPAFPMIWSVLAPLLQFVEELLDSWRGLTVSSYVQCPKCQLETASAAASDARGLTIQLTPSEGIFPMTTWQHFLPQPSRIEACLVCKERIETHYIRPDFKTCDQVPSPDVITSIAETPTSPMAHDLPYNNIRQLTPVSEGYASSLSSTTSISETIPRGSDTSSEDYLVPRPLRARALLFLDSRGARRNTSPWGRVTDAFAEVVADVPAINPIDVSQNLNIYQGLQNLPYYPTDEDFRVAMYADHRQSLLAVREDLQAFMPVMPVFGYLIFKRVVQFGDDAHTNIVGACSPEEKRRQLLNFMLQRETSLAAFLHFANALFVHCHDLYIILRRALERDWSQH